MDIESLETSFGEALQIQDKAELKQKLATIEDAVMTRMLKAKGQPRERQALMKLMSRVNDVRVRELGYPEWRHVLNGLSNGTGDP